MRGFYSISFIFTSKQTSPHRQVERKREACGRFLGNVKYVAHIKIKARHCERSEAECGNLPPEAPIPLKPADNRVHFAR